MVYTLSQNFKDGRAHVVLKNNPIVNHDIVLSLRLRRHSIGALTVQIMFVSSFINYYKKPGITSIYKQPERGFI